MTFETVFVHACVGGVTHGQANVRGKKDGLFKCTEECDRMSRVNLCEYVSVCVM